MYVVVICKRQNFGIGVVHPAAITGYDRDELVRRACAARDEWELKNNGPYDIYVGELTHHVTMPVNFILVPLTKENNNESNSKDRRQG